MTTKSEQMMDDSFHAAREVIATYATFKTTDDIEGIASLGKILGELHDDDPVAFQFISRAAIAIAADLLIEKREAADEKETN